MKPVFATITLFFFVFTLSTKPSPVRAATSEPVVDTSGESLKAGERYYVLSAYIGKDGGLTVDTFGNDTCPNVVVQEDNYVHKGKPVKFLPLNPKNHVVYTSRNLNIEFSDKIPTCSDSGVWKITKFINEGRHVGTNGVPGNNQAKVNWFTIEKAESDGAYKIKFCPDPKVIVCQDLDIFFYGKDGKRYVGLTNPGQFEKLRVKFQKAHVKNAIDDADEAVMSI